MNGGNASSPSPASRRDAARRGRRAEVEALVTSDGAVWTWGQLIEEFGPAVRSYAMARGVTDADDVVQDVFAAVVQKVPTFCGTSADLRSFVFTVAFRRIADRHRRAYRRRRLWGEPGALVEQPDESVLAADDGARAIAALDRLDERSRAVLRLRYIDGCDVPEVAARMDLSTTNVRAIQSRALKRLRERVMGLSAGVRQWSPAVLAWSSSIATRRRRRVATGAWARRGGALGHVRVRMLGGGPGLGDAGVGAAGGASLVVAVSLTAASILGAGGSTATEGVPGTHVVMPQQSSPAAGATPPAPTSTAQMLAAPRPPEPYVGPLPTGPDGSDAPMPVVDAADESTANPATRDASDDDPASDDPEPDRVPVTSGHGSPADREPAIDVVAVPGEVVDRLGDGVLATSTDALTASVTDVVPATIDATVAIAVDASGTGNPPADSNTTAAPMLAPAAPEVGLTVIALPAAGDQLSLTNMSPAG